MTIADNAEGAYVFPRITKKATRYRVAPKTNLDSKTPLYG